MSEEIKTMTVDDLIARLTQFPSDTKVFFSSDAEGNGYNTLSAENVEISAEDKSIIFYPMLERLYYDQVFPKLWEKEAEEDHDV